jgi:hypothetical protein
LYIRTRIVMSIWIQRYWASWISRGNNWINVAYPKTQGIAS